MEVKTENKFIICECNTDLLMCTKFLNDKDKKIYLSLFSIGQFTPKPTIWQRLKYCFYHLKTGKIYEDQLILSYDKCKQLGEWLIENSK